MKKGIKILILGLVGVAALAGIGAAIFVAVEKPNLTGTIKDPTEVRKELVAGTGEYDWRKTNTHIDVGTMEYDGKFYSNHSDDRIYNISIIEYSNAAGVVKNIGTAYDQSFSWSDDLDVCFVFNNGCVTTIETSDIDWLYDHTEVSPEEYKKYDWTNAYVSEVWVKTVD